MRYYIKDNKLWVDFSYKGVRCRESLKIKPTKANQKYAERLLGEIENRILAKTFNYADYFPESKKCLLFGGKKNVTLSIGELFQQWLDNAEKRFKAQHISRSTLKNYHKETKAFVEYFDSSNIKNITKADIDDFIIDYSIGRKAKTVNNSILTLKQVFNYAVEKEYLETSPMLKIVLLKTEKPDIHPFSHEEMMAILNELKESRVYPIIATLFFTGMRIGEALSMKWENVDFHEWTYHVRESFSNNMLTRTKTKESKRIIELTEPMQQILQGQKSKTFLHSEFIFLNSDGKPYTSSHSIIRYYWKPVLKKLGIEYRIPYQCRHTFAVLSLKLGDDPEDVAKQLGHTSLQMLFTRYARFIKNRAKRESKFAESVTILARNKKASG
ncbi:MAG: DUF3596 domain-containing protein [Deferribacterales bacterium]